MRNQRAPSPPAAPAPPPAVQKHSALEDAHALLMGALFIAFGFALLQRAELTTGGTAGIALTLHYVTGASTGLLFFLLNLPFYLLAWRSMGRAFTLKTLATNFLLAGLGWLLPEVLSLSWVNPLFAALGAGTLMGMGVLALARHRASVGGIGILAIYFHEKGRWRAGRVQLICDAAIILAATLVLPPDRVALSVASAVALSLVLIINHKPGRYAGY
ncbi:YitT family protein [Roseomonas sp. BN140053]|uniref:YitT family protein n=1 Tax=Roseomonas sp. BN140053 TaxID=3391898 RepID=UPI0039E872A3